MTSTPAIWSTLRHRQFRALWRSGGVYFIGNAMQVMAAAWMMIELTGSDFLAAAVQTHVDRDIVVLLDDAPTDRKSRAVHEMVREIDEWFAGTRRSFSLSIAWPDDLSPLSRTVLETLVERVPWGETVSYGELAELAGRPRAAG